MQHHPGAPESSGDAGAMPHGKAARRWPLPTLGGIFLRIGATAFGGLGAALVLVERELVAKRRMLTAADVTEALTAEIAERE